MRRALDAWARPETRHALIQSGMSADWSWQQQGQQYVQLYEELVAHKHD